jgi:autotransporter-associated beta strand protein
LAFASLSAKGATLTWTGNAGDGLIGTAGNWNPSQMPASSDVLIFGGTNSLLPQLVSNLTVDSITFNNTAGAFTLGGSASYSMNANGVTNNSTSLETINNPIKLLFSQTWNASAGALVFGGDLNTNTKTLTITGSFATTISGVISETGALTKSGTGTLTLSGTNTYSGVTTVSAGILCISNGSALGAASAGTSVASGAMLELTGNIAVGAEAITSLAGTGISNGGALLNVSGNNSWAGDIAIENLPSITRINSDSGTLTLNGNFTELGGATKFLTIGGAGNVTINGTITQTGDDLGLTKDGTGTLTLANANSYGRPTTLNGGVLLLTNATALPGGIGASGGSSVLTINGGVLGLGAGDFSRDLGAGVSQVEFTGSGGFAAYGADRLVNLGGASAQVTWASGSFVPTGSTFILGASGADKTVTFQNPIALGAVSRTVQVDDGSATVDAILSGVLSGTGGITKTGNGTLSLTGTNTYAGGSTINAGVVVVNSAASLGATSGGLALNAGTLEIATGYSTTRVITLGDATSTFQVDPSQTFTVTSAIGGSGSLNKTGAGTMVLGAAETYTGSTNVSAGTLQINASNRIVDTSALTVSGGTFDLQTFGETVAGVTLSSGSITGSGAGTLTGSSYTLQSGTVSAILAGSGTVTKNTSGTVTLSGVNILTGAVTVSAGTLILAAAPSTSALGSTTSVTVNSGGTLLLGGSDQINNSATMTLAGGTFTKGNFSEGGAGAVGLGALTLTATGSHIDFGTGTVGVLTFASFTPGAFTLTIDNWTGTANTVGSGSTDRLIFNSDQTLNLASFQFTGFASGAVEFGLSGGYYEVVPTATPEPATYFAGLLALGALGWSQRRRWRSWLGSYRHRAAQ